MNILIVVLTILFITLVGFAVIRLLNLLENFDNLLKLSYSYGFGVGLVCFQLYIYSRLNIAWEKINLILPWLIVIAFFLIKRKSIFSFKLKLPKFSKINLINLIFITAIMFSCGYVIFEALIRPATVWDSWATWLFQSKIFFIDNGINPKVLFTFNFNYPFIYNLLGTFIYIVLGKVDDTTVLLTSSAFYLFLALLIFSTIKKRIGLKQALLFTLIYAATQNFIRHGGRIEAGMADLSVGYYAFCCLTLLLEYLKNKTARVFLVLSIFLGITSLVKLEGMAISILIAMSATYVIYKNKLYKHLLIFMFWILPIIDWEIYKKINGSNLQSFAESSFRISFKSTVNAFLGTFRELINIKSWNFLWITYFYSLFTFKMSKKGELAILNFIVLSQLSFYILIYILFSVSYSPESSIERLLVQIAPIALYEIAIMTTLIDFTFLKKMSKLKILGDRNAVKIIDYFFSRNHGDRN